MSCQELGGDGSTDAEGVALSQRTAGVLNAALGVCLRMTGGGRAPLAQLLQFFERELADECQLAVEHGCHVTRVEEEAVAAYPGGICGVVVQVLAVEYIDEICATHGAAGVTTLGLFDHRRSQNTDVVCCVVQYFNVVHVI